MKIECILHRDGGTKADIGGTEYHFAPQDDGAHVADVTDEAHIERFLSIHEAYRGYAAETVTSAPLAQQDGDRQEAPTRTHADDGGDTGNGSDERAALAEQYKTKFGKAPHHKWSADTIRDKLAAEE